MSGEMEQQTVQAHGFRRKLVGKVIKDKMHKSIVVECETYRRDPIYGKYVKHRRRYHAHDELNTYKIGDMVEIQEHRPISKTKRFIAIKMISKFVEG